MPAIRTVHDGATRCDCDRCCIADDTRGNPPPRSRKAPTPLAVTDATARAVARAFAADVRRLPTSRVEAANTGWTHYDTERHWAIFHVEGPGATINHQTVGRACNRLRDEAADRERLRVVVQCQDGGADDV